MQHVGFLKGFIVLEQDDDEDEDEDEDEDDEVCFDADEL